MSKHNKTLVWSWANNVKSYTIHALNQPQKKTGTCLGFQSIPLLHGIYTDSSDLCIWCRENTNLKKELLTNHKDL